HDHVTAAWRDIHAVRALGLRREKEQPLVDQRLQRNDWESVDALELAGLENFNSLLPRNDVKVIGIVLRRSGFKRRIAQLDAAGGKLGVDRVEEHPAVAGSPADLGEV